MFNNNNKHDDTVRGQYEPRTDSMPKAGWTERGWGLGSGLMRQPRMGVGTGIRTEEAADGEARVTALGKQAAGEEKTEKETNIWTPT